MMAQQQALAIGNALFTAERAERRGCADTRRSQLELLRAAASHPGSRSSSIFIIIFYDAASHDAQVCAVPSHSPALRRASAAFCSFARAHPASMMFR
jgi:hypothetical protein